MHGEDMPVKLNGGSVEVKCASGVASEFKGDAVSVGMFEDKGMTGDVLVLDKILKGEISSAVKKKEISGGFKDVLVVPTLGLMEPAKIIVIGLGKSKDLSMDRIRRASAVAAKVARASGAKIYATTLAGLLPDGREGGQAVAEGTLLGLYRFLKYKTMEREKITDISDFTILCRDKVAVKKVQEGCDTGCVLAGEISRIRDMINTPSAEKTPEGFAEMCQEDANDAGLSCKIYNESDIKRFGMNGLLAVASGSDHKPKLVVIEYNPKAKKKVALIGKGITFDAGGLDIKPRDSMVEMKGDMAGAAAVLGTMAAASRSKLGIGIVGVIPVCENMPSGKAYKPGDVIKSASGKTVEVADTDAEGRLIVGDALAWAEKTYKPDALIDMATLTGACIVALGYEAAGLIGTDHALLGKIKAAAERTGERVWELPLWDKYKENVKSDIADIRNIPKGKGYEAGTIAGAAFLSYYVTKPWAHLDIAGTAWSPEEEDHIPKGATGWGVRLLWELLKEWK